jgi:hypothetical protein
MVHDYSLVVGCWEYSSSASTPASCYYFPALIYQQSHPQMASLLTVLEFHFYLAHRVHIVVPRSSKVFFFSSMDDQMASIAYDPKKTIYGRVLTI